MEQVRRLIPVNPHAPEVVSKKIVKRIPRKEAQAVWNPVCFVRRLIVIWFGTFSEVPDGLCALVISARPNS